MTKKVKPYCEDCRKKPTIHLTEIIDGKMSEMHLCDKCPKLEAIQSEKQFGLADLLAGLADFGKSVKTEKSVGVKCDECGLTYEDFRKFGRLGCSHCYDAFRTQLSTLLKKIHGTNQHFGKAPRNVSTSTKKKTSKLQDLKKQLILAVKLEDFEKAAIVRDKIREIEKGK
ncbi:MAG: protein arginine kinase activator [Lysobacterales bacterium]|jgi:protein arginine kinase activator